MSSACYAATMNELDLNNLRIALLKAAIDKTTDGNVSEFGRRLGYRDGAFVRQMLGGARPVTEKSIRAIEALHGLAGWFQTATGSSGAAAAPDKEPLNKGTSTPQFTESGESAKPRIGRVDKNTAKLADGRSFVNIRPVLEWDSESELGEEYVLIPRLDIKVSAGNGRIVWEVDEKGQKQAFRKSWIARLGINPGQAATVVADGSSMEPRVIDGDSLVVDYKATNLIDGKVYVLAYQNEVYVKRLFKRPGGGLTIRSDNPDKARYPDMEVLPADSEHVEIIARVVAVSGAM